MKTLNREEVALIGEKMLDAINHGEAEFSPLEASIAGAFFEDALSIDDVLDALPLGGEK